VDKRTEFLVALIIASTSAPSFATQYYVTGTIAAIRTHTFEYATPTLQGVTILQLSSPFANGCTWGFILATDTNARAALLSARAAGMSVGICYDNSITSPWGDTTACAVVAIDH
jgi:hypothetical protein